MSSDDKSAVPTQGNGVRFQLLERITAAVLLLVIATLGWLMLEAYQVDESGQVVAAMPVIVILVLLVAALILVSVVALMHTR